MRSLTRPAGRKPTPIQLQSHPSRPAAPERAPAQCCAKVTPTVAGCHD